MADTFTQIVGRVQMRVPAASRFLAEDWVRNAFRRCYRRRRWAWLVKQGQFLFPAIYNTGTVTVTRNSNIVTGSGTAWDATMVGLQFRTGTTYPIYTIQSVDSATQLTLQSDVWGGATASAQGYSIYRAYVTVPSDFQAFISVWDPNFNWQLVLDYTQNELNAADAQRSNTGNAYLFAWRGYSQDAIGAVAQPVQVTGTGSDPGSAGTYTGPNNALFTVQITTAGASGTAVFKWKKDDGTFTTGVTTDSGGAVQDLQDGVQVYFPTGVTYTLNDVWVIQVTAGANPGNAVFEVWPHIQSQYVLPYLYECVPPDISDSTATIPKGITGDILLEGALEDAAMWPGPSADRANAYYRLELSDRHRKQFEHMLDECEVRDENQFLNNTGYQMATGLPFAPIPALGDASWLQKHDI